MSLTPAQTYSIIDLKNEIDSNKFDFFRSEFRTQNFYIIKSSMGDTKHIESPSDLYPLPIDKIADELEKEKLSKVVYDKDFERWAVEYLTNHPS